MVNDILFREAANVMALRSPSATGLYRPLSPTTKEIRILILEPGPSEAAIKCHLQHVSLNSTLEFEALSYMWGDPSRLRRIHLSGHEWTVTENLERALRHHREEQEPRPLWVDALCINQSDMAERSQQVGMMREIYATAERVIARTGKASQDSEEAIELIKEMGRFMRIHDGHLPPMTTITADDLRQRGFDPSTKAWGALWALFDRPYWGRVWMVQELASHDSVVIVAGYSFALKGDYIRTCILIQALARSTKYRSSTTGLREEPIHSLQMRDYPKALGMRNILSLCNKVDTQAKLLILLSGMFNMEASDYRDRIYAIMGVVGDELSAFPADYTKPKERVFQDYVKFLVRRHHNLLCLQGNRQKAVDFGPSWIPALSTGLPGGAVWAFSDHPYRASGGRAVEVVFDENCSLLHARGIMVGRLRVVHGPFTKEDTDPQREKLYSYLCELDEHMRLAVWRALVMDTDLTDWDNPVFPAPQEFYRMHRVLYHLDAPPRDFEPRQPYHTRCVNYVNKYEENMNGCLLNRQFFATDNGYVGIGPFRARMDDVVVILFGGTFSFVLRPKGEIYELIGDAYVQGVMLGELVAAAASTQVRTFTLC